MNTPTLRSRFTQDSSRSPADRLVERDGSLADYEALAGFHYLAGRPGIPTRILVLADPHPPIAARFNRQSTIGNRQSPPPVAVLIESYPALSCKLRDLATGDRYAGWSDRRAMARLLNAEVRCISRVVVHPQWRGLGLAVRLVRRALGTATTPYTEALAAMGRVHPFFAIAGMTEYRRHPHPRDQRLLDALRCAGAELWELASDERMRKRIADSKLLQHELRRWAGANLSIDEQITKARSRLLCEPVYYIRRNY